MDKNEKLIEGIYQNALPFLLKGVSKENKEKLKESYRQYLSNNYSNTLEKEDDITQVINVFSMLEVKKWCNKTEEKKMSRIIPDESLTKLREMSEIAFKYAQIKLGCLISGTGYIPELTKAQVEKYIDQMKNLRNKVAPYNELLGDLVLSEGIKDFEYSINLTENMSLRLSRLK